MSHLKSDGCALITFRANISIYFKEARKKLKKKENKEMGEKERIQTKYFFTYNLF